MSTTISMWLGIAFLFLCVAAVLLQAWLWGPKFWNEHTKKTEAPRAWLRIHALCGYAYGTIYVFMMWHMLPRLWEYQYELPARTIFHAVMGITIGVLLLSKISILVWFRHFEESMPYFGFGLLLCTVILSTLSIPYAVQAHDISGRTSDPDNVERVRKLLAEVEFVEEVTVDQLVTAEGFSRGRNVLVKQCTTCHDMRTILTKPRTPASWYDVSARMLDKPSVFGERLQADDIPYVTAYLTAITPEIQESTKRQRAAAREDKMQQAAIGQMVHDADTFAAAAVGDAEGTALVGANCTQCHELDEIPAHGGDDVAGWRSVVAAMVEEGAEIDDATAARLAGYLAKAYPAKADANPPLPPEKAVEPMPTEVEPMPTEVEPMPTEVEPTPAKTPTEPTEVEPTPAKTPTEPTEVEPAPAKTPAKAKPKPSKPKAPPADAANGRSLFLAKCKTCHGNDGKGDTPYGIKLAVPSLENTSLSKGVITSKIANGIPGTKMKPYKDQLTAQEIADITAFVKRL